MTKLCRRWGLPLILLAFLGLGVSYAVITPVFEISDELWHYPMVKRLADGQGLPVQDPAQVGPWRQEGSQPPLYYGLMAAATFWIDTSDLAEVRWLNPHADNGVITADGNNNMVIHTYREAWPWRGTVLAVRLIRLLSVLLGLGVVYCTYRLALEVAPERYGLALTAAALVAFTPMFIFISASVNNDTLAILCTSAALWLLARRLRNPALPVGEWLGVGLLLGAGALSKESAVGMWGVAGGVWGWDALRRVNFWAAPFNIKTAWARLRRLWQPAVFISGGLAFGTAVLLCGWWYWRNLQLYGDWLGWNAFVAIVGARSYPATLAQLWGERVGFVMAYWGLFGGVSVPLPGWVYTLLNGLMLVSFGGALGGAGYALARRRASWGHSALWLLLAGWVGLIGLSLIRWTSVTWASQGRLIFPAISAIGVLAAGGWDNVGQWLAARAGQRAWVRLVWLSLPIGCLFSIAAAAPWAVIAPHYAPPLELSAEQLAAIPQRVDANFGGEMQLLGYALETPTVRPGEAVRLTLYWQSLMSMDRNWSIFLHVIDTADILVAQRDRYPGQGALATTLLRPGQTFADEYVIWLPETAYAPVRARIEVGLYDLNTGERLPLADGPGDAVNLAEIDLQPRPGAGPNPIQVNFNNQLQLSGYAMSSRVVRAGETLTVTLNWQGLAPMRVNYSVFARVWGPGYVGWAAADAWPQQGAAPTSSWKVGQVVTDTYALTLKPDTPPGLYDVEIGVYDGATMHRLQVVAADGRPTDAYSIYLSDIRVLP